MKKALITGITGQDGSYLAEFLLEKGYEVHGVTRRASISNTLRIDHLILENAIRLHDGDLSDSSSLIRIINLVQPDEIYNLAAQSHVQVSFDVPEYSGDVMQLVCCVFWKRLGFLDLLKKRKFIRLLQVNCTVKLKKYLKMKLPLFIPTVLMLLPNSMVFGSQRNIVRHMVCLPVTASYLTTNLNAAAKTL